MVWHKKDDKGRELYIKKSGNFVYLTRSKDGALQEIPEGWELDIKENGRIKLVREK